MTRDNFLTRLACKGACLVTVHATRGSVPRETGAWMAVFGTDDALGSIGGGHLEFQAIAEALRRLSGGAGDLLVRYVLGPTLGQCCGGEVVLRFERVAAADIDALRARLAPLRFPLALFGGGHVGRALVQVFASLPLHVSWIDSRDQIFPVDLPSNAVAEHSDPVQAAVPDLAPHSRVLIMSFSHAEDLELVAACLMRQRLHADLPYIGLIGSKTKWASFSQRLRARGFTEQELAHVTCPIGVAGIPGKAPEVIAVAVAAQILLTLPQD